MQKKIKILHIINSLQIGGAEKNLVSLSNYLSQDKNIKNYEIHIISIDDISSYYKDYLTNIKNYDFFDLCCYLNYRDILQIVTNLLNLVGYQD